MPEIKVGLEIHGYLNVATKLFCDNRIEHEAKANTNICPVCTGMPGSKPMLPNRQAVLRILAIAGMLGCRINQRLLFQRKHYNWPDMPTGYQRTMSGSYSVPVGVDGEFLGIGIQQVHLEEDPARWDPETGEVDYNRSGTALVEIVTNPDFTGPAQVREWLKKLMTTLAYIKAIDADAGVKADVNVSIGPKFERVEIKNVNSFKSIVRAIEAEVLRQEEEVAAGKRIPQQTRAWNETRGTTDYMRSKEAAMDYMFIPDPDLPLVLVGDEQLGQVLAQLPEKPGEKSKKFKAMGVDATDADILSSELELAGLFEELAQEIDPVLAARWLRRELLRVLHYNKKELHEVDIETAQLRDLLKLVQEKKITDTVAQKILEKLVEAPLDVNAYVEQEGLGAVSDTAALETFCTQAIAENPQAVADFKAGNDKALNFVVGSVMRKSKGTATPNEVNEILRRLIG